MSGWPTIAAGWRTTSDGLGAACVGAHHGAGIYRVSRFVASEQRPTSEKMTVEEIEAAYPVVVAEGGTLPACCYAPPREIDPNRRPENFR